MNENTPTTWKSAYKDFSASVEPGTETIGQTTVREEVLAAPAIPPVGAEAVADNQAEKKKKKKRKTEDTVADTTLDGGDHDEEEEPSKKKKKKKDKKGKEDE